jgi:hypothetical protein
MTMLSRRRVYDHFIAQERENLDRRASQHHNVPKRAGRKLGRRAVEVDLARVERHRADGMGLRAIAAKLGISVNSLQRAMQERKQQSA